MILVGQNNHGKSNIFSAILFFFGAGCTDTDYNHGSEETFVEITFDTLDEKEKARFTKYLSSDSTLTVRRQCKKEGTPEYKGYVEIPNDDWLKEENISEYANRDAINATPLRDLVPATGRVIKDHVREAQQNYIAVNRANLTFARGLEDGNFAGQKTLPSATFGEVYYIPAVKNAADDFNPKGKNPFNNLLSNVINDMSASNAAYMNVKEKIRELAEVLSKKLADGSANADRPKQLSRLEELLETELATWNTKIDIDIAMPDVDEALRLGTTVSVDDGVSTDINKKGNGLQRSLIFALIKAWAKVSVEEKAKRAETATDEEIKESKSSYFLFEEPELYLHPQAQRELFSSLKILSESESQVFLSTHSSSFIDLGLYESICVVCKNSLDEGTQTLQCTEKLFGDDNDEDYQQFQLTYYINPDRGELFFARKVILVEGQTEKSVITYIAKRLLKIHKYEYTIIDCATKNNIPLFIKLLNKFRLPYIAVYDRDHQADRDPKDLPAIDKSSQNIEDAIDAQYGSSIILENDIEEEIGLTKTGKSRKPYKALVHVSAEDFACTDTFKTKIETIYA